MSGHDQRSRHALVQTERSADAMRVVPNDTSSCGVQPRTDESAVGDVERWEAVPSVDAGDVGGAIRVRRICEREVGQESPDQRGELEAVAAAR